MRAAEGRETIFPQPSRGRPRFKMNSPREPRPSKSPPRPEGFESAAFPGGPPAKQTQLPTSTNALFWIWLGTSLIWILYNGSQYALAAYRLDWWALLEFLLLPSLGALGVWRCGAANGWADGPSIVDPLRWSTEQRIALLVAAAVGFLVGTTYALARAFASQAVVPAALFWKGIGQFDWYWPWASLGAIFSALALYCWRLLRS